jgi:hypothetical protein
VVFSNGVKSQIKKDLSIDQARIFLLALVSVISWKIGRDFLATGRFKIDSYVVSLFQPQKFQGTTEALVPEFHSKFSLS